jgi:hypothetical protein
MSAAPGRWEQEGTVRDVVGPRRIDRRGRLPSLASEDTTLANENS